MKPASTAIPLHPSTMPWVDISMDFITNLPLSVTVLFPHHSILLFFHTRCLLTWRGRCLYTYTSYLFIRTNYSFCFFNLSTDLANS